MNIPMTPLLALLIFPMASFAVSSPNSEMKQVLDALKERKGTEVKNTDFKGKFTFIDFWGTWCGACVAEIDKIEDLYVNNPVPEKLNVTTIACYDKKTLVDEFMEKKGFKYQVLMSDDKIEKQFKVQSYPTKLLLLPNNVYLAIGFRDDYKAILKKYTEWEL